MARRARGCPEAKGRRCWAPEASVFGLIVRLRSCGCADGWLEGAGWLLGRESLITSVSIGATVLSQALHAYLSDKLEQVVKRCLAQFLSDSWVRDIIHGQHRHDMSSVLILHISA